MTRWARAGNSQKHKKMPEDPTSWEELSKGIKNSPKCKKKQNDLKEDKSLENVRMDQNSFNDNKKKFKVELCDKNFNRNQKTKEESFAFNSAEKRSSCDIVKNPDESQIGGEKMSKRQLKKLKKLEKRGKAACNAEFECTSHINNICKDVSIKNSAEENGDCSSKTLNIKTVEPINDNALSKKQLKRLKDKSLKPSVKLSNKPEEKNSVESHQKSINFSLNEKKLKKKELFMRKLQEKRLQNGITLLPQAAENRLYRIKKRLREKGYTPEMIKNIIRKERRKAELEFRKTSFTKTCFNCGQPGHFRAECHLSPNKTKQEIHTCSKCDSAEHNSSECTENDFGHSFLTCFVCKGQGHISRDCPDKKRRTTKEEEEEPFVALHTLNEGESIDDEIIDTDVNKNTEKPKFKKPKVIVF